MIPQTIKDKIEAEVNKHFPDDGRRTTQSLRCDLLCSLIHGAEIALSEIPQWISCKEQMPEVGIGSFLALLESKPRYITDRPERMMMVVNYDESGWIFNHNPALVSVTHWMLLPSPPQPIEP